MYFTGKDDMNIAVDAGTGIPARLVLFVAASYLQTVFARNRYTVDIDIKRVIAIWSKHYFPAVERHFGVVHHTVKDESD